MMAFYQKYRKAIKLILLLLVLAFIGQFIMHTDFEEIGGFLKKMPFTFLGVIGLSVFAYLSATIAWRLCLGEDSAKAGIGDLFMIRHVGEMLAVFNPTSVVAGETFKAHYLGKRGISNQNSISSILMSRVLIILSALLLMLLSTIYLIIWTYGADKILVIVILGAVVLGGFGYLLARFLLHSKLYLAGSIKKLRDRLGEKYISDRLCESVEEVNRTAQIFYNQYRFKFYSAFLLSIVHWVLGAAEFYLILKVLGFDISLLNAIAIEMGVILFKTVGAIVPGQIGVEEYANKVMLGMVGIASNEVWLTVSIVRRARQIFWVGVAGVFYWIIRKEK